MFERYTEKARRVIFFSRYEASQLGAQAIEAEHILLGLLRDNKELTQRLFPDPYHTVESIRKEIEARAPHKNKNSVNVDLPLSQSAKLVLSYAADESDRLQDRHIGTEHLLLGLIKEEKSLAAQLLREYGLTPDLIVAQVVADPAVVADPGSEAESRPATWRSPMSLQPQINMLTRILMARGIITPEEFAGGFNWRLGHMKFEAVLELLVSKGVISEAERQEIVKLGE